MRFSHLTENEISFSGGFTHRLDFSYRDITAGIATNTILTLNVAPLPKIQNTDIIKQCLCHLTVPFENTADSALNNTTISLGLVTGGVAALIAAFQANVNGTEVIDTIPGVATPAVPIVNTTANNQVTLTFNSMAAKTVSNLNKGQAYILIEVQRGAGQSVTKATPFGDGYT